MLAVRFETLRVLYLLDRFDYGVSLHGSRALPEISPSWSPEQANTHIYIYMKEERVRERKREREGGRERERERGSAEISTGGAWTAHRFSIYLFAPIWM